MSDIRAAPGRHLVAVLHLCLQSNSVLQAGRGGAAAVQLITPPQTLTAHAHSPQINQV